MNSKKHKLEDKTYNINDVEVFKAGKWNGYVYTKKDLIEMVENFGIVEAPLKLGHSNKQELAGRPAVGWIKSLRLAGDRLLADITDIPHVVYELIKKNAYKKRSAELFYGFKDGAGKIYNNVFAGLALLGEELPALNTLADVVALYKQKEGFDMKRVDFDNDEVKTEEVKAEEVAENANSEVVEEVAKEDEKPAEELAVAEDKSGSEVDGAGSGEDNAEVKAEEVKADGEVVAVVEDTEAIKAENQELKKKLEELEVVKAEMAKLEKEKEEKAISNFMLEIEKKIAPAVIPMVKEILMTADNAEKKAFSISKDEMTQRGLIMKAFASMPDMTLLKVVSKAEDMPADENKVFALQKKYMGEGLDARAALDKVYVENPELRNLRAKDIKTGK